MGVLKKLLGGKRASFLFFYFFYSKGGAMRGDTVKESLQYTRRLC